MENNAALPQVVEVPRSFRWYEVFPKIFFHPSLSSFKDILADPSVKASRALLWVFVAAGIVAILDLLFSSYTIRDAVLDIIISVIGLAASALILHLIARSMRGSGTFTHMLYTIAAVQAPYLVLQWFMTFLVGLYRPALRAHQATGFTLILAIIIIPIALAWSIYTIGLDILSLRAAENLTTRKAIFTLLIFIILAIVLIFFGISFLG